MDGATAQVGQLPGVTFLVEVDVSTLSASEISALDDRFSDAFDGRARYLGPVATHDAFYIEVEAASGAVVAAAAKRAGLTFDRVIECIRIGGRMRGAVCATPSAGECGRPYSATN